MENNYYQKKLFLAQVNESDNILGQVERWEAHEKGILHRGFTAILQHENKILLQQRKHKAFDGLWDMTFSSHQIYKNGILQSDDEAIYEALEREWYLQKEDVENITPKGKIYYKAEDSNSIYTEHEIDYIYLVKIKSFPRPNLEYAYGYEIIDSSLGKLKEIMKSYSFAPWVEKMINAKMI